MSSYSPLAGHFEDAAKGRHVHALLNNHPNGILDANGKILPEVREARERGDSFSILLKVVHFSFEVAEKCLQQDFLPDTISTDLS